VTISHDNKYIVSASSDKTIKVFDLTTQKELYSFIDVHVGRIRCVAISNDNKYIISGSDDESIKVFDFDSKREIHHFKDAHQGKFNNSLQ